MTADPAATTAASGKVRQREDRRRDRASDDRGLRDGGLGRRLALAGQPRERGLQVVAGDPVPVRRYCHQLALPSLSGLVSGRRRAAGPLATRHAARPMTSRRGDRDDDVRQPRQVARERRPRLGLQEPEEPDEQQDEPDAERQ